MFRLKLQITAGMGLFMKKRIISAAVYVPLLILMLLIWPEQGSVLLSCIISMLSAFELTRNTGLVSSFGMCLNTCACSLLVTLWCAYGSELWQLQLLIFIFLGLLMAESMCSGSTALNSCISVCICAGLLLPLIFSGLIRLACAPNGGLLVFIPFVVAFLSDSGAYFTGCSIGKHRFAPDISPNKTLEGVFGGILWSVLGMLVYILIVTSRFPYLVVDLNAAVLCGALGSVAATFGDLCFSYIKRSTGIKDFGMIIPGHGGILDRFDSMTTVLLLTEILISRLPIFK